MERARGPLELAALNALVIADRGGVERAALKVHVAVGKEDHALGGADGPGGLNVERTLSAGLPLQRIIARSSSRRRR